MDAGIPVDIWSTGAFSFESPLKDLLDSGSYTLEQLLSEDELLQELRGLHPQLLEFFSTEEAVIHLLRHVLKPPPPSPSSSSTAASGGQDDPEPNDSSSTPAKEEESTTPTAVGDVPSNESPSGEPSSASLSSPSGEPESAEPTLMETDSPEVETSSGETPDEAEKLKDGDTEGEEATNSAVTTPVNGEATSTNDEQMSDYQEKPKGSWLFQSDPAPPPPERSEEEEREYQTIRYPYVACEIICCEINAVIDTIVDGTVPSGVLNGVIDAGPTPSTDGISNDNTESDNKDQTEAANGVGNDVDDGNDHLKIAIQDSDDQVVEIQTASASANSKGSEAAPTSILDLFFSVLYETDAGDLDDYRAGYFDKILSVLCRNRPIALANYINDGGRKGSMVLMRAMMKHMYSHSILQVVQRLMIPQQANPNGAADDGTESGDNEAWRAGDDDLQFRCTWSDSSEAVDLLLSGLMGREHGDSNNDGLPVLEGALRVAEAQNASEVLITIIQKSPLQSPILITLTNDPVLSRIIDGATTLKDGEDFSRHDSTLTFGMNVLESLVLQLGGYGLVAPMGDEEADLDENGEAKTELATTVTLSQHLPKLLSSLSTFLCHPSVKSWTSPMQFAPLESQAILGTSRLRIVRLIESLVLLGNPAVDDILCQANCLDACLDLFWEFEWNSMLHQSVANLLVHVFEGANTRASLQAYLLNDCQLLRRLVESFEDSTANTPTNGDENNKTVKTTENQPKEKSDKNGDTDAAETANESKPSSTAQSVSSPSSSSSPPPPPTDADMDDGQDKTTESTTGEEGKDSANEQGEKGERTGEDPKPKDSTVFPAADGSSSDTPSHVPALRKGYMGHVIIICQALVHACSNHTESEEPTPEEQPSQDFNEKEFWATRNQPNGTFPSSSTSDNAASSTDTSEDSPTHPPPAKKPDPTDIPVIASIVERHPLHRTWQEFVATTLAAETAIQSAPLGGYQNATATNSFQTQHMAMSPGGNGAQFTGEDDDDDDDDDDDEDDNFAQRTSFSTATFGNTSDIDDTRGMTNTAIRDIALPAGPEDIGIDDNDVDSAVDMFQNINGGTGTDGNTPGNTTGTTFTTSFVTTNNNYIYDDPLGNHNTYGGFDRSVEEDSDDDSDEEDRPEHRREGSGSGPPVMDLFAGNLGGFEVTPEPMVEAPVPEADSGWSDFANFDAMSEPSLGPSDSSGGESGNSTDSPVVVSAADGMANSSVNDEASKDSDDKADALTNGVRELQVTEPEDDPFGGSAFGDAPHSFLLDEAIFETTETSDNGADKNIVGEVETDDGELVIAAENDDNKQKEVEQEEEEGTFAITTEPELVKEEPAGPQDVTETEPVVDATVDNQSTPNGQDETPSGE